MNRRLRQLLQSLAVGLAVALIVPFDVSAAPLKSGIQDYSRSPSPATRYGDVLRVHCCHSHPYPPYDRYCCHGSGYRAPGRAIARTAVGAAVSYGVYRGVRSATRSAYKHGYKKGKKHYKSRRR